MKLPWNRALVLAPHTDDGELGCGGTIARLIDEGCDVHYVAFSICSRSLPDGSSPFTLREEATEALSVLGIPRDNRLFLDFDVRTFTEHRQAILDALVALGRKLDPDVVFLPSSADVHQDHQAIAAEGLRAFKTTTVLGYELPWNSFGFRNGCYIPIGVQHLERKVAAIATYRSQKHRPYADADYTRSVSTVHGTNIGRGYAEAFEVYRVIAPGLAEAA